MSRKFIVPAAALLAAAVFSGFASMVNWNGTARQDSVQEYAVDTKEEIRHDMSAYTQGFFFYDGYLYESTGQYGESSFRKVDPATGKVLRQEVLPAKYFGEGSCVFDGRAYILTWYEGTCLVYDIETFTKLAEFPYQGEGWGLTTDGRSLIMSDGTSTLSFRDPMTFLEQRTLTVKDGGREVPFINELEYIDGKIWANIYGLDEIFIIDPVSGSVTAKVNCRGLLDTKYRTSAVDVFNGIAWNPEDGSLYLTGKYWPRMYKVTLK